MDFSVMCMPGFKKYTFLVLNISKVSTIPNEKGGTILLKSLSIYSFCVYSIDNNPILILHNY